jgi:hypothetical protein
MSGAAQRLQAVSLGLTARERATLLLRAWVDGREPDERLVKHMPAEQREECERTVRAVEDANNEFRNHLAFMLEWLYQEETLFAWLECLDGFLVRTGQLEGALSKAGWVVREGTEAGQDERAREIVVPPLPVPGRALERDLPIIWGGDAFPDDHRPLPGDWQGLRGWLVAELQRALTLRWQDYIDRSVVLAELSDEFGEEVVHPDLRAPMDGFRRKVLELYEGLQRFVTFPLPDPDHERIEQLRGWVRWDDIRPEATGTAGLSRPRTPGREAGANLRALRRLGERAPGRRRGSRPGGRLSCGWRRALAASHHPRLLVAVALLLAFDDKHVVGCHAVVVLVPVDRRAAFLVRLVDAVVAIAGLACTVLAHRDPGNPVLERPVHLRHGAHLGLGVAFLQQFDQLSNGHGLLLLLGRLPRVERHHSLRSETKSTVVFSVARSSSARRASSASTSARSSGASSRARWGWVQGSPGQGRRSRLVLKRFPLSLTS